MEKNLWRLIFLSSICAGILSCGGGSSSPSSATSTSVTGLLSKGPVDGATCTLYNTAHQAVAGPVVSNKGALNFGQITATGALTVECTGGTYTDESSGSSTNSSPLNSGVTITAGVAATAIVTPLTHMAYQRAAGDATQIAAQAKIIANALGLGDVNLLATRPTDVNTLAAGADAAGKYGAMLATVAQYMKDQNLSLPDAMTNLTGAIDNTGVSVTVHAALQTSVANLAATGAVKNNVTAVKDSLQSGIQKGTGVGLSLTAANPKSLTQGAAGSRAWTLAGAGFPKSGTGSGTGTVLVKLNGIACTSSGTVTNLTTITGVDCSNVTTSPSATSATLSLDATLNGESSQPPTQTLAIALTPPPTPALTFSSHPSAIRLGKEGTNIVAISDSPGAITYSGSNDKVASVSSSGSVTPVALGKLTITATQAAVQGQYSGATVTYELTITDQAVPTLGFASSVKNVTLGDADFSFALSTLTCPDEPSYSPSISYSSSDPSKASVNSSGKVVIKAAGSPSITATAAAHSGCIGNTQTYVLNIGKATPNISFNNPITTTAVVVTNNATVTAPSNKGSGGSLPSVANLQLSYASSDPTVASVSNTGLVTPLKAGLVTITASVAGDSNYWGSSDNVNITASYALTVSPMNPAPDCSGANCAASSATHYAGSGIGVWRYNNDSSSDALVDINLGNVKSGLTVSLLYSNPNAAVSAPSSGVLSSLIATPAPRSVQSIAGFSQNTQDMAHDAHTQILNLNQKVHADFVARRSTTQTQPRASAALGERAAQPQAIVTQGSTRTWNENAFGQISYNTTAVAVCPANTFGRRVVIWVQDGKYVANSNSLGFVNATNLTSYQNTFCGTASNNYTDGSYYKIASALGDVWGSTIPTTSIYSGQTITESANNKLDINIVIVTPSSSASWGGYFYSANNILKTNVGYSNSNESLVFFVNANQTQAYINTVLIHELTHMINQYQRGILHNDWHETWLEETSAMMTQDIFDPGVALSDGCLPIVCNLQWYAFKSGGAISYFTWPSDVNSATYHYYLGSSFAAFLNRRYGLSIYVQLMSDCYTPTTNTTSYACLNFLIQKNGGISFADEFARFGASVFGLLGGQAVPGGYGFPSKSGFLGKTANMAGDFTYTIPSLDNWWTGQAAIPTAVSSQTFPKTSHLYQIDTVGTNKTSYIRKNIRVPAGTSLIVVVK